MSGHTNEAMDTSSTSTAEHSNQAQKNTTANTTNKTDQYTSPLNNLQKIQQKKQAVLAFPHNKKLLKLAIYSKCQVCMNKYNLTNVS